MHLNIYEQEKYRERTALSSVNTQLLMSQDDIDTLVTQLAQDGISITKDDAQFAVRRLAELLLFISRPFPLLGQQNSVAFHEASGHVPFQ